MRRLDELSQLSEEELQLLLAKKEFFQRESLNFADEFYSYLEETPELVSIVQKHSTIKRIKEVQKHFFESLSEEEFSDVHREYINRIGQVHHRIGLESYWIIKFMNVFLSYIET